MSTAIAPNPYTDPNVTATRSEVDQLSSVAAPAHNSLDPRIVAVYNSDDVDRSKASQQAAPPHRPTHTDPQQDVYANGGWSAAQPFLDNTLS